MICYIVLGVSDVSADSVLQLVKFLYQGEITVTPSTVDDTLRAASLLGIHSAAQLCQQYKNKARKHDGKKKVSTTTTKKYNMVTSYAMKYTDKEKY